MGDVEQRRALLERRRHGEGEALDKVRTAASALDSRLEGALKQDLANVVPRVDPVARPWLRKTVAGEQADDNRDVC